MVEPVFGRWGPTEVMERVLDGTWAEVVDGMGLIQPESITYSGTSMAITGLGSVEFDAVSSLSLNGVFSSDFDNYMIVYNATNTVEGYLRYRLRSSGSDNTTASSYTHQQLGTASTSLFATRVSYDYGIVHYIETTTRNTMTAYFYGPALAQPTAARSMTQGSGGSASIWDQASTHNQSTAYDGLTLYPASGTISGRIAVYGMVK